MTTEREIAELVLLDKQAVEVLLSPEMALEAVVEAFTLHAEGHGRVFPVVREPLPEGAVFGIKSGGVEHLGLLGFKAAGFWPKNRQVGGEAHQATIVLFDQKTGRPRCMIDGNAITTMRTGAAGALGLKYLARNTSRKLCVFGTGVQAKIQLYFAMRCLKELETVYYVSVGGERDPSFEAYVEGCFVSGALRACVLEHTSVPDHAVYESDVVITATPGKGPLFSLEAVSAGTHFNCVGADTQGKRELPEGLLERVSLFVDDHQQARTLGESQWAPAHPSLELGALLSGRRTFIPSPEMITVFDMTGLALQDLTVAQALYSRAQQEGLGVSVPWGW